MMFLQMESASEIHEIPIGTLHRYKEKMRPGNTKVKKLSMVTTQVSKI